MVFVFKWSSFSKWGESQFGQVTLVHSTVQGHGWSEGYGYDHGFWSNPHLDLHSLEEGVSEWWALQFRPVATTSAMLRWHKAPSRVCQSAVPISICHDSAVASHNHMRFRCIHFLKGLRGSRCWVGTREVLGVQRPFHQWSLCQAAVLSGSVCSPRYHRSIGTPNIRSQTKGRNVTGPWAMNVSRPASSTREKGRSSNVMCLVVPLYLDTLLTGVCLLSSRRLWSVLQGSFPSERWTPFLAHHCLGSDSLFYFTYFPAELKPDFNLNAWLQITKTLATDIINFYLICK